MKHERDVKMEAQRSWTESLYHEKYSDGKALRYVNPGYRFQYEMLLESGLYKRLVSEELLLEQRIIGFIKQGENSYCVMQQQIVPCVTYPYEWSFGQMKDAALTTLRIQRLALGYGMTLYDVNAQNMQFIGEKAILTDALCFELFEEGADWSAYGSFCRHFLAPLLLVKHAGLRLYDLLQVYSDGIPLELASKMLIHARDFTTLRHIHWHAISNARRAKAGETNPIRKMVKMHKSNQIAQIESLIRIVENLVLDDDKR